MKSRRSILAVLVALLLVATFAVTACGSEVFVTFVYGGDKEDVSVSVEVGHSVEKPQDPTRDGYTFGGWYYDEECTDDSLWDFSTALVVNTKLYAKWIVNTCKVTFVIGGGVANQETSVTIGGKVTKPADPTREGFVFGGWFKNATCAAGEEFDFNSTISSDTTIYAKWTEEMPDIAAGYDLTSIADIIAIANGLAAGGETTEKYYVLGTITTITHTTYGNMKIADENGTELVVYGTYSADGTKKFGDMDQKPDVGDLVLFYGVVMNYKGTTPELKNANIIAFATPGKAPVELPEDGSTITVAKALEIANSLKDGETTTQRYTIENVTIKTVSNPQYGEMTVVDKDGNEIYIYGTYSADGVDRYPALADKPYAGDTITVTTKIGNYKGTPQLSSTWIQSVTHNQPDVKEEDYEEMTVAAARDAAQGALVKVSGVVAAITYANGKIPSGFILVDDTSSIYVYDGQIAPRVSVGNTVTILASKTWWILNTEASNAEKFGYKGCNQLENATLKSNDEGNTAFNTSWIQDSTVKQVMETPVTTDITTLIFKVNALIKKVPGDGFINYYIDDLDGKTGSYVYTQCNGGDFAWMDEFDGKICTTYFMAINAKSTSTGCVWRYLPVKIVDEHFTFNLDNAGEFAVTYYGVGQFASSYASDPELELLTTLSSELLGFENATLSYTSSDTEVAYIENGVFHTKGAGKVTITITGRYGDKRSFSKDIEIEVVDASSYNALTVAEAIATPLAESDDDKITVRGVVGPSLVNQNGGFYLIDDTGVIAVKFNVATDIGAINLGDEIIITGTRDAWKKEGDYPGQTCITKAVLVLNLYGKNQYSTASFTKDKTFDDLYALIRDVTVDHTTEVWVIEGKVNVTGNGFSTNYSIVSPTDSEKYISLYSGSGAQYSWLESYVGKTVTVEIALCNWNAKNPLKGCLLAVHLDDGTVVYNLLNFNN